MTILFSVLCIPLVSVAVRRLTLSMFQGSWYLLLVLSQCSFIRQCGHIYFHLLAENISVLLTGNGSAQQRTVHFLS